MWILLTVIAASAVAGAALLVPTLWPVATLGGLLGLVALLLTWPVGPFLLLQAAALTNHYAVEVGPVSVRAEHVATIVVGVLLVLLLWRKKRPFLVTPAGWFALAWWSMNVLATIVNAVDPRDSVRHIIRLGLMVATYLIVINLLRTPRAWRIAAAGFLTLGALEAAYGLLTMVLYQLGFDLGLQVHRHIPIPIPYGTLQEGNLFGSHSASWALAFMWLVLARWRSRLRWWFVIGLARRGRFRLLWALISRPLAARGLGRGAYPDCLAPGDRRGTTGAGRLPTDRPIADFRPAYVRRHVRGPSG
jgi:hypothetical protein